MKNFNIFNSPRLIRAINYKIDPEHFRQDRFEHKLTSNKVLCFKKLSLKKFTAQFNTEYAALVVDMESTLERFLESIPKIETLDLS